MESTLHSTVSLTVGVAIGFRIPEGGRTEESFQLIPGYCKKKNIEGEESKEKRFLRS